MITDANRDTVDALKGVHHHEPVHGQYRPMRGQAYVVLDEKPSSIIHTLPGDPREDKYHRGKVIALGPPARATDYPDSPEVPWGFDVGADVLFHMFMWLDRMRVLEFQGVTGRVAVIGQAEIFGVVET